jgi:hypothetical protein
VTASQNLTIPAYADLRMQVDVIGGPESLVGYTGKMQIRATVDATVTLADYGTSEITIDTVARTVSLVVLAAVTATYAWTTGVYDLVITGPDGTYRLVQGNVIVQLGVTRS